MIFVPCSVRSIFATLLQFDPCVYVLWWRNGRKVEGFLKTVSAKQVNLASTESDMQPSPRHSTLRVTRQMLHNNGLGLEDARLNISRIGFNFNRKLLSEGRR